MGEMWPRIYNLAEKSASEKGQMWAPGTSGSSGNLAPRWAESHLSAFTRERWVFIPEKTRGSCLAPTPPLEPRALGPRGLSHRCPLRSAQLRLPFLLPLEALTQQPRPGPLTYLSGRSGSQRALASRSPP